MADVPDTSAIALEERLSPEAARLLAVVARLAGERGVRVSLVGGIVRDLLLGRRSLDLDVVVEGDAIALARAAAAALHGKLTVHQRFGTATVGTEAMFL